MHLDIFGSDTQCHIPFPNFISKFFNSQRHVDVNPSLYLILRAFLGVLRNKYNTYSKALPITESGRTVFHRLGLNLWCGSPFCCITRNNTDVIPGYKNFYYNSKAVTRFGHVKQPRSDRMYRKIKKIYITKLQPHTRFKN